LFGAKAPPISLLAYLSHTSKLISSTLKQALSPYCVYFREKLSFSLFIGENINYAFALISHCIDLYEVILLVR